MKFHLKNEAGIVLGMIVIDSSKETLMLGSFSPAPEFSAYASIFNEFEYAANNQLLSEIDRLEKCISRLSFYISGPLPQETKREIDDLQIIEGGISFHLKR